MTATSTDAVNGAQLYAISRNVTVAQAAADQALADLQATVNQLLQSGLCSLSGGTVSCGRNLQLAGGTVQAGATDAVALGSAASVRSSGGIAVGQNATAVRSNSVAIGAGATALSSVAIGTGAQALGANTTAVGDNAVASTAHVGKTAVAVAVGYYDQQSALGLSITRAPRTGELLSAGIAAVVGGRAVARAGVAIEF